MKSPALRGFFWPRVNSSCRAPSKSQAQDICFQIVGLVQPCRAPCDFVMLLQQVSDSVTFDLSQKKAQREQTRRTLAWLRQMESNARDPADKRYEAMLTLLD